MKKVDIIKSERSGQMSTFTGDIVRVNGYDQKQYNTCLVVDLDRLAKFLAKYVVKEDLIED